MKLKYPERCLICYTLIDYESVDITKTVYKPWKLIDILQLCTNSNITKPASVHICLSCSNDLEVVIRLFIKYQVSCWSFHTNLRNELPMKDLQELAIKKIWREFTSRKNNSTEVTDSNHNGVESSSMHNNYNRDKSSVYVDELKSSDHQVEKQRSNIVDQNKLHDVERCNYLNRVANNLIQDDFDVMADSRSQTLSEIIFLGSLKNRGSTQQDEDRSDSVVKNVNSGMFSDIDSPISHFDNSNRMDEDRSRITGNGGGFTNIGVKKNENNMSPQRDLDSSISHFHDTTGQDKDRSSITGIGNFYNLGDIKNENMNISPQRDLDISPLNPYFQILGEDVVKVYMPPVELIPENLNTQDIIRKLDEVIRLLSNVERVSDIVTLQEEDSFVTTQRNNRRKANQDVPYINKPQANKKGKWSHKNEEEPSSNVNKNGAGRKQDINSAEGHSESQKPKLTSAVDSDPSKNAPCSDSRGIDEDQSSKLLENLFGEIKSEPIPSPSRNPEEESCILLENLLKTETSGDLNGKSSEEKLYRCWTCNLIFKRHSCLLSHRKKVHNLDGSGIYDWS